jgi:hypothetical protein
MREYRPDRSRDPVGERYDYDIRRSALAELIDHASGSFV